jgi:Type I phosphodiesterase / nucleotide pyrophosphatase
VLGAVPPTFLVVARNGIVPEGLDASFGVRYWACTTFFLLTLSAAAVLTAWAASRLAGVLERRLPRPGWRVGWLPRVVVMGLGGSFTAAAFLANGTDLPSILSAAGPVRLRLFGSAATIVSLATVAALIVLPLSERRVQRRLGLFVLVAAAVALLPRSGPGVIPPALAMPADAPPLCVIGLDGADWNLIERLFARGELPHLRELRSRAAWGPLRTVKPTHSPLLWNTMATGRGPEDHRIDAYRMVRFPGLHRDFADLEKPWGYGLSYLYRFLRWRGIVFQTTITSADRRVPAYWNLATRAGGRVAVLNWWASWPAEPVNGFVVSERIHYARLIARRMPTATDYLTYPPELYREIEPLLVSPEEVTLEDARRFMDVTADEFEEMKTASYRHHVLKSEFKYMYSMFDTNRRIARFLLRRARQDGQPADFFLYFRLPDLASHAALKYSELVDDHLDAKPQGIAKYGKVVTEAYRQVDRAVGDLVSRFGEGNMVIVSDHGFELERPKGGAPRYAHEDAPAGIFLGVGPAFRPGRVEGLSIYEVFPTLAYLKGLPIAEDLDGRVALEALEPEHVARHPIQHIATYGTKEALDTEIVASPADKTMIDRLRALGYVR